MEINKVESNEIDKEIQEMLKMIQPASEKKKLRRKYIENICPSEFGAFRLTLNRDAKLIIHILKENENQLNISEECKNIFGNDDIIVEWYNSLQYKSK